MMKSMKFKSVYVVVLLSLLFSLLSVAGGGVALAAAGDLVPLGDQLGDVGQYYSQVGPSMKSRVHVQNTSGSNQNVRVEVYNDTGSTHTSFYCNAYANGGFDIEMKDISTRRITLTGVNGNCNGSLSASGSGYINNVTVYGVYSMKVCSGSTSCNGGDVLAVAVDAWHNAESGQTLQAMGAYQANPSPSTTAAFPALIVSKNSTYWWNSEIVVFNTGTAATNVNFIISDEAGNYWQNNQAYIEPKEHRVFLLSQLIYKTNGSGGLIEDLGWYGWYSVLVASNSCSSAQHSTCNGSAQSIAASANVFLQTTTGSVPPKSEKGSSDFYSLESSKTGSTLYVPGVYLSGSGSYLHNLTVGDSMMDGYSPGTVTLTLYDSGGTAVATNSASSVPADGFQYYDLGSIFSGRSGLYTVKITNANSRMMTAVHWYSAAGGYGGYSASELGGYSRYFPLVWDNNSGIKTYLRTNQIGTSETHNYTIRSSSGSSYSTGTPYGYSNGHTTFDLTSGTTNNSTYYGVVSGSYWKVAAAKLQDSNGYGYDDVLAYEAVRYPSAIWYVPFAPAPVVQFAWQSQVYTGHPGPKYGTAGAVPSGSATWARDLNWYYWSFLWNSGQWTGADTSCRTNDRYLAMDKGLADYPNFPNYFTPNTVFNSTTRMNAVRNLAPSACAGRPLLLANEPDLYSWQGFMSYPELGREMFVYRSWPGELFSPAFAHTMYTDLLSSGGYHPNGVGSPCYMGGGGTGCFNNPYVNLIGLADYYVNGGTFSGLGFTYWGRLDGIAFHSYSGDRGSNSTPSIYLRTYRNLATTYGIKLMVTEYAGLGAALQDIANDAGNMRQWLVDNLGGYSSTYNYNPSKLMWYGSNGYGNTDLFDSSGNLTNPVGQTWDSEHGSRN